jgi:hypothetical protein
MIEFYKDEQKFTVVNQQNAPVCVITIAAIVYFYLFFFPVHWAMARVQFAVGRNYQKEEAPCYQCSY